MGELINLAALRRAAQEKNRMTLAQARATDPDARMWEAQRVPPGNIAHRVERRSPEPGRWQVWTQCGTRLVKDAPARDDDLLCLRCYPWLQ